MKNILLVQFRDDHTKDHEIDCYKSKLDFPEENFLVINPLISEITKNPEELLKNVGLVILGGSGQYDLTKEPDVLMHGLSRVAPLLDYILENDFPTLAVCLGHQALSQKLGATIKADPLLAENDTVLISLTTAGKEDKILSKMPEDFYITEAHKESVVNLPEGAVSLATNEKCPVQMYRYKNNIYSIQGHPELAKEDIVYRWKLYPEYIKGKNLEKMKKELKDTSKAAGLLNNFVMHFILS